MLDQLWRGNTVFLHELAANTAIYGAIAQPWGRLLVEWRLEAGSEAGRERLMINWHESGVAMPDGRPPRRGYGTELITQALPYQLQAETTLAFATDSVRCRVILPAGAFTSATNEDAA